MLALTQAPVMASHSCARALCDSPRNLSDDMLLALKKNGGVIQLCIFSDYLPPPDPPKGIRRLASVSPAGCHVRDAVDHIDHIVRLIGIDHVGIGTDFDGGGGLADCSDVTQLNNITIELVRRGYSEKDIAKIWGGNALRVLRQVQEIARKRTEGK